MADAILEIRSVHASYGRVEALRSVSLSLGAGELVSLLGSNGAGKSTTLNVISGLIPCRKGEVIFEGKNISNLPSQRIVGMGVVQVPEGRSVFRDMTVRENLELGGYLRHDTGGVKRDFEAVLQHFPRLEERLAQKASTLSGGEQQMLAMGRALMSRPRVLMLDEPSMGLSPILVQQVFSIVREMHRAGLTILLVEQVADLALSVSDRAYVLKNGENYLSGTASELRGFEGKLRDAYLGS